MAFRQRVDILLFERGLAPSREKAKAMVMAGEVEVNGHTVSKPGTQIESDALITLKAKPRFVSRGGEKLEHALTYFGLNVEDRVCADVGASTGGFTDCLLQHGVLRVYAIDVGYGQLDYSLRIDPHVIVLERTNARYVQSLPEQVELVTVDASFISLKLLLPVIKGWMQHNADIIPLIKPQFEAGRKDVGKGGVVRDALIHARVLRDILTFAKEVGFNVSGLTVSPLKGPAGNIEFLAWLSQGNDKVPNYYNIDALIESVLKKTF
ncbi:MAG: TlyA family RNA methyltransferase [Anaerolineae bacterium]